MQPKAEPLALQHSDWALLAAFVVTASLGSLTNCLMVHDGAVILGAVWLGNAWDLYLGQIASRSVATLLLFGPAWAMRSAVPLSSGAFLIGAHVLYFTVPLGFWFFIRRVEPNNAFSRLFLAVALAFVFFPSELIVGIGLWMIWAALAARPECTTVQLLISTMLLGVLMVFTHPATMLMTAAYLLFGAVLAISGRHFPKLSLIGAAMLTALLLAGYLLTSQLLPPTNPTIIRALTENQFDFVNPWWMLATMGRSPMLAALWVLLIAPGAIAARLRWRLSPIAVLCVLGFGLWFAANGVTQVTWIYVRHVGVYVLVLALALAIADPAMWSRVAQPALMSFAAIMVVAAASYSVDLVLLERYIALRTPGGIADAEALTQPWPPARPLPSLHRVLFKWTAGADYVRDVVVPDYDWYLLTLAFQSFFLSQRTAILYHGISDAGWIPYECPPVKRALAATRDPADAMFLRFVLTRGYCTS